MAQSPQPTTQLHVGKLPALCRALSTPTSWSFDLHVSRWGKDGLKRLVRENRRQASVRGRRTTVHGRIVCHSRDRKARATGNTKQTYTLEASSLLDHTPLPMILTGLLPPGGH